MNPWEDTKRVRAANSRELIDTLDVTSAAHVDTWLALKPDERASLLADRGLAAKVHEAAGYALRVRQDVALPLFDDLLETGVASYISDALWAVTPAHTKLPFDEARCRRYIAAAEGHAHSLGKRGWWIARLYKHLGDVDGCIKALRKTKAQGEDMTEPRDAELFRDLWSNEEFAAIFADMEPTVWNIGYDEALPTEDKVPFVRNLQLRRPGAMPEGVRAFVRLETFTFYGEATTLPEWLLELTKLRVLKNVPFEMTKVSHSVLSMPSLRVCELYGQLPKGYDKNAIKQLVASFHKDDVSQETRLSYLDILVGKGKESTDEELVAALGSGATKLSRVAQTLLEARWKSRRFALKSGAEIVVGGRIAERSVIKDRLERVGVKIKKKVSKKTTAVVLGAKHAGKFATDEVPVFLESHLHAALDAVDKRPLDDAPAESAEQLSELLMSTDESNVRVALEMIKQGGKPEGLLEKLLLIAQYPEFERKLRNRAKTLFERHAGAETVAAVRKNLARTSFFNSGETKLARRLAAIGKGSAGAIDAMRLATLMYERSGDGLKFLLKKTKKPALRRALLDARRSGNKLDLSKRELPRIPDEIAELSGLQEVDLEGNHITELNPALFELGAVKMLNLSENRLRHIPEGIASMRELQTLWLGGNWFTHFPHALTQLSELRELGLSREYGALTLVPLIEEMAAMTSLEALHLRNHVLEELPVALKSLPALRALNLRGSTLARVPTWLMDMPALKELNVEYLKAENGDEAESIYDALGAKGVQVTR